VHVGMRRSRKARPAHRPANPVSGNKWSICILTPKLSHSVRRSNKVVHAAILLLMIYRKEI
jgi:hypothetical protein